VLHLWLSSVVFIVAASDFLPPNSSMATSINYEFPQRVIPWRTYAPRLASVAWDRDRDLNRGVIRLGGQSNKKLICMLQAGALKLKSSISSRT